MSVPERNRDALPKKNTEVPIEQILEALDEIKDIQTRLDNDIQSVKAHLTVQTDKVQKNSDQFEQVMGLLGQSEAARTKAKQNAATTHQQLMGLVKQVSDTVNRNDKSMKDFLNDRERKLGEALSQTRNLNSELVTGFGRLVQQAKTPFKQRIAQTFTVAASSLLGGVIVFLICFQVWGHVNHSTTANTTAAVTKTAHSITTNKK